MKRLRQLAGAASFALLILTVQAFGQNWQVPNHYVPIGRGAGVTGFGSAAPVAGALFQATTTGANPAFTVTPTLGVANTTKGTLSLTGNTSGTVLITPQATAGSPTLTLPNASGTFAISATSPVAVSATTGNVTCTTCVTSSGGGAITGTAPVAVSAAGAVSITGAAGQVLAGASPAFTATPTLGASGILGTIAFGNATSGTITLSPVAGALGTVTLSLPAATDTLVGKATTDTLTNKTYDTAATGNSFSINGLAATANTGTGSVVRAIAPSLTTSLTVTTSSATGLTVGLNGATNPALQIDASTASSATGIKVKSAAAAAGVAVSVITSGTNENLTVDAAGSGTITLGGTSTGAITLTRATTLSAALTYGGVALSNAVTGTGNMVLSANQTLTGTTTAAAVKTASIFPPSDSTTALQIFKTDGSTRVMDFDTTNARVGINKTPGAFDLDVNATVNVGTTLTFGTLSPTSLGASPTTVSGLTANNTPNTANDYFLYFSAADGAIRKCTVAACTSAGSAGVTSIAANVGAFTLGAGLTNSTNDIRLLFDPGSITNCTLVGTVSGNALTVALKTQAGADPGATTPCVVSFRNATAATGDYTAVNVTAATSFVTGASGSSFGSSNSTAFRIWITAWNNAGTVVLGVSNQSLSTEVFPLDETSVQSSTACNACTNAATAGVFYTTATQTSKAIRILGFMEWSSGLATAGTWASGPTTIQMFGPGVKLPGDVVRYKYATSTSIDTGTATSYTVTSTTLAFALTNAVNLARVRSSGTMQNQSNTSIVNVRLSYTSNSNVFGSELGCYSVTNNTYCPVTLIGTVKPNSTSSLTYAVYIKNQAGAATWGWNQGPLVTVIEAEEIMGALPEPVNDNIDPGVFSLTG